MATSFLLESSNLLRWNPLLHTFPIRFTPIQPPKYLFYRRYHHQIPKLCCALNNNKDQKSIEERRLVLHQVFAETIFKSLKALQKPLVGAVLVGFLLLFYNPNSVVAASGGRMGGRSFSSSSSSLSSSSSRSYSTPRTESVRSYTSAPYFGPSPFGGGGFYVGPAVGFGSSFFFIVAGFAAFVLVSGFLSDKSDDGLLIATEKTSVLKLQVFLRKLTLSILCLYC